MTTTQETDECRRNSDFGFHLKNKLKAAQLVLFPQVQHYVQGKYNSCIYIHSFIEDSF